jgi:t-SNARE complex subunit (syntaxin)
VSKAKEEVAQANARKSYCVCNKRKMICYGGIALILVLIVVMLLKTVL